MKRKITLLDVSVNSMYTIFLLFLKVMYRIWCHHLSCICACAKDSVELFVSDVRLGKIFSISGVVDEEDANCVRQLNELVCFDRSSLLTSLA